MLVYSVAEVKHSNTNAALNQKLNHRPRSLEEIEDEARRAP